MNLDMQNNKNTVQIENLNLSRVQRTFHTAALYWLDKTEFPFADLLQTCTMLMMRPDFNKDDASFILKWLEQQRRDNTSNLYKTLKRPNVELKDLKSVKTLLARRLELRLKAKKEFSAPTTAQPIASLLARDVEALKASQAAAKAKKIKKARAANKAKKAKLKAKVKNIKAKSVKAKVIKSKKVVAKAKVKIAKKNIKKVMRKTRKLALMKRSKVAVRGKVVARSRLRKVVSKKKRLA